MFKGKGSGKVTKILQKAPSLPRKREYVLLHTPQFVKVKMVRRVEFYNGEGKHIRATWCWALKREDVEDFKKEYSEVRWIEIKPFNYTYSVEWSPFDWFVTTDYADPWDLPQYLIMKMGIEPVIKSHVWEEAYGEYRRLPPEIFGWKWSNPWAIVTLPREPKFVAVIPIEKKIPEIVWLADYYFAMEEILR